MTWLRPVLYRSSTPSVLLLLKGLIFIGLCLWYSMLIQVPEMCFDPLRIGWQCGLWPRSEEEGPEWQGSCSGTVWSSVAGAAEGAGQSKRLEQITVLLFNYSQPYTTSLLFVFTALAYHRMASRELEHGNISRPLSLTPSVTHGRRSGLFAGLVLDFQRVLKCTTSLLF